MRIGSCTFYTYKSGNESFFFLTLPAAQNNRCQPAKPSGCSLFFVLSFNIVLFHLSTCRNPSSLSINSCMVNLKQAFHVQSSLVGHANLTMLALLYCPSLCYHQLKLSCKGEVWTSQVVHTSNGVRPLSGLLRNVL